MSLKSSVSYRVCIVDHGDFMHTMNVLTSYHVQICPYLKFVFRPELTNPHGN